jgi:hypothetical protein
MRHELMAIQEKIDDKRKSMKRHIGTADDMIRAIDQTGTALINKDIRASLEMDWAEEVLDADDAEEQSEEEDDKESVRIR